MSVGAAPVSSVEPEKTVASGLPKNLRWSVIKNTVAQMGGRNFIALGRLIVASIIVRTFGAATFGQYSLILGIMTLSEWLVDFGTTEFFVREICRRPERTLQLLRSLTATKILQVGSALLLFVSLLFALHYPLNIIKAALVGAGGTVFFGGVLIYRVVFRSTLTMEREVLAELLGVLFMIPLVASVHHYGGGLTALLGCHMCSRIGFFLMCAAFGSRRYKFSVSGVKFSDVVWNVRSSSAMGAVGFLVGIYEVIDLLLLSKLGTVQELAYYSAAQKLTIPLLIALTSISGTLYPLLSTYWPENKPKFNETCQHGVDAVVVLAGLMLTPVLAGANFFMGLLGPAVVPGAPALRVLVLLCFVKAISSTLGPILYVVRAQNQALRFTIIAVIMRALVVAALIPKFGYIGVAFGALAVEIVFAGLPVIRVFQRTTGYRVRWAVPLKSFVIAMVAAGLANAVRPGGGLIPAILAPVAYLALSFLTRTVKRADVQWVLNWRTA